MSLLRDFKQAQLDIRRNRKIIIGHNQKLELHGLYAQAEFGDNTQAAPKKDMIIWFQKWEAHQKHMGMEKEEAMRLYIELVSKLLEGKKDPPKPLPPLSYPPPTRLASFRAEKPALEDKQSHLKSELLPAPEATVNSPKNSARGRQSKGKNVTVNSIPSVLQSEASRRRPHASLKKAEAARLKKQHGETMKSEASIATIDDNPRLPPLPPIDKPSIAKQDESARQELFASRRFSTISGVANPLNEGENLEQKFMIYEKLRAFYSIHDPKRIKKGLGAIVEWTIVNGEDKLNEGLRKKYNSDLNDNEKKHTEKVAVKRNEQRAKTRAQLALSQRLVHTKDISTRKKMDKLTRFLLVNDPELVSHGMFLMMKFIENKGLGALNENLKKNYGKSLDSVSDAELNSELKKKYGNDLGMLDRPLFGDKENGEAAEQSTVITTPLQEQILNMDRDKLKEETQKQLMAPKKPSVARSAEPSFDEKAYMHTLQSPKHQKKQQQNAFHQQFRENHELLREFLEIYEPYRLNEALDLIGNYMKRHGLDQVNRKLRKKYDVDLTTFKTIEVNHEEMNEDEFNVRVLQFVTKHEKAKNIERAIAAMTSYKRKQGIAALNTKLFMKYGETLNDLDEEVESEVADENNRLSMAELHKLDLPPDLKEKLRIYYTKYDPTILAGNARGIERIFQWTERNGTAALDQQLKSKYKESLTEFIQEYSRLNKELIGFYTVVDRKKLDKSQLETVLSWAMVNGRDALNYNLRKKYDRDLTTFAARSSYLGDSTIASTANPDL